ncbi:hypothetical protein D9757_006522 [Collybiopsis confluens]|uniref:Glucanase n=1 Tax=Collybiopsis confluens TaxID=2823264 RepID=A0A8H5MB68_9AGAR|nr:hypothetical protein D9757_006522 [Collybiopsis confluens]
MKVTSAGLFALVSLLPFAAAQAPIWGQCGGIGWTGPTTCASGSTCTVGNPYFSQCLPGTASSSSVSTPSGSSTSTAPGSTGSTAPAPGSPFTGTTYFLSPPYASEVAAAAKLITNSATAAKAASVANIPTFIWLDSVSKIAPFGTYLSTASAQQKSTGQKLLVPIVIYDLPDRDCAALASNGEFSIANNGAANYKTLYIDPIVALIKQFPDVKIVAVIEPDSLANLVTNLSVAKCANAQSVYLSSVTYAIQQLSAVGVTMYLDAGHAGWLGWPANLGPAAQLFISLYQNAGKPSGVRGLATNVANYNALVAASPDPITQGDPSFDEMLYIQNLAPLLGSSFPAHFIVDQGRSGQQNLRQQWGDWCNVVNAGFGTRPTTNTGSSLIDAIVWVKPGGECDGTSNSSSPRFDAHCALSDAAPNAPEAGTWFQSYFETLVTRANPSL